MNSNGPFNNTHPIFSKQLLSQPFREFEDGRYQRTSTYFRKSSNNKKYSFHDQPTFRIESYSSPKISHKQLIQSIKSSLSKKIRLTVKQQMIGVNMGKKSLRQKEKSMTRQGVSTDSKNCWQRYLNQEISHSDLTKLLNKNELRSSYRERSKSQLKGSVRIGNKIQKSSFYVNNFLRNRKKYHKVKQQQRQQKPLEPTNINEVKLEEIQQSLNINIAKTKRLNRSINRMSNEPIVPWQKGRQEFQDPFNIEYCF